MNIFLWTSSFEPYLQSRDCHYLSRQRIFTAFVKTTVGSISSSVTAPYTHTKTFQSTPIPRPSACYVVWQTKGCLILLSVSVVSLPVLRSPPSSCTASQTTENPSLFVNWRGSGERIVAKCSAACLSLTFSLFFFCSAFYQQTKKPSRGR